ncbi:DUF551 domain-containing protein [Pedobacter sp. P351]|uniref:DUF551 domain-containing protein n=1 Tax=Pedobacter superstes TaxID=3133441 RepID=UPI003094FB77
MRWISVLESLPAEMEFVLLYDEKEGLAIGYNFDRINFVQSVDGLKLNRVSHWMPIPAAPVFGHAEENCS